jgi:class 3 adenylate cyclase
VASEAVWFDRLPRWIGRLALIGSQPTDDEDGRLRKGSLVLTVILVVVLAVIWVTTYSVLGLYDSAAIPFGYQLASIAGLIVLARTKRFDFFRVSQLVLMLLLPVLLQWSLGGFAVSGGVILWALITPLAALVFSTHPLRWFIGYLLLIGASGLLESTLTRAAIPASVTTWFFVLNIGGVSVVAFFLLRYFMHGFAVERQRSEQLLLNVLPVSIARRLKAGERPLADRFETASVLFADLVGFTPMSERLAPEEVIELLDALFSRFDEVADGLGLEKIKTVGDSYMVVGGLPEPREDAPETIAEMALSLREVIEHFRAPSGARLDLRIGIDIGPVVAGVIGTRKFTYDLWGDTVNTASRMESHGVEGRIQVTPRAYERLRHRYAFDTRGLVEVKGKGEMITHFLTGRLTHQPG